MATILPEHHADYSPLRREWCMRYLADHSTDGLTQDAKIQLVVGMLLCTESGYISRAALDSAARDPSVINAARQILKDAF